MRIRHTNSRSNVVSAGRVTMGKEYEVLSQNHGSYQVKDDHGHTLNASREYNWEVVENSLKQNDEGEMVMIKQATIINGKDSDEMSIDAILSLIEKEQERLFRLTSLNMNKSKAIVSLVEKHQNNINALVEVLEGRV